MSVSGPKTQKKGVHRVRIQTPGKHCLINEGSFQKKLGGREDQAAHVDMDMQEVSGSGITPDHLRSWLSMVCDFGTTDPNLRPLPLLPG